MIFIENSKGSLFIQLEKVFRFNKCSTCYGFQKSNNKSYCVKYAFKWTLFELAANINLASTKFSHLNGSKEKCIKFGRA